MERPVHATNAEEKRCPECNGVVQVLDEWEICENCGRTCFNKNRQNKKPYKKQARAYQMRQLRKRLPHRVVGGRNGGLERFRRQVLSLLWGPYQHLLGETP